MPLILKHIANASIFALVSLGSAIASTEILLPKQPAFARESLGDCIQGLRNRGVSTQDAARICRYRQDQDDSDDRYENDDIYDDDDDRYDIYDRDNINDRDNRYDIYNRNEWERNRSSRRVRGRFIELRARSGPTPEGSWRYSAPGVPYNAMQRAGCQHIFGNEWRCASQRIRVQIPDQWRQDRDRNRNVRYIDLRARSGSSRDGRWLYSTPGVPYNAMQRAGCQHLSGNDWYCASPRIRVEITNRD